MTVFEAATYGYNRGARDALTLLFKQIAALDEAGKGKVFPDGPLAGVSIEAANGWAKGLIETALTAVPPTTNTEPRRP